MFDAARPISDRIGKNLQRDSVDRRHMLILTGEENRGAKEERKSFQTVNQAGGRPRRSLRPRTAAEIERRVSIICSSRCAIMTRILLAEARWTQGTNSTNLMGFPSQTGLGLSVEQPIWPEYGSWVGQGGRENPR